MNNQCAFYARLVTSKKMEIPSEASTLSEKRKIIPKEVISEEDLEETSFNLSLPNSKRNHILKELEKLPPTLGEEDLVKREQVERVSKFLARVGVCSKQQGVDLIKAGQVKVNGILITESGQKMNPFYDVVTVKGVNITKKDVESNLENVKLYAYHKPRGVLCSRVDNGGNRETIYQRLERMGFGHLISVGRLDYNSEGLILLTNDGNLSRHLELPQTGLERQYLVRVHGQVSQPLLDSLQKGSTIEGVHYAGMKATLHREGEKTSWIKVILHEGKNREIRKIFQQLNLPVSRIMRIQYGPYKLENIQKGQIKVLELKEEFKQKCSNIYKTAVRSKEKELERDFKNNRAGNPKSNNSKRIPEF
ncbi:predicted protein [Naegleria gruberi]|uniref:Predicted protein n=1 Tax=Naegleria gruberi TaxID=5762 RepID=D2UX35_NAEGR|nr:uncharacterized protein NAEGRDRAFT_61621 [Naegleria gruberi]EFC50555.1 predicted protein [Naegleria gruberi]|eukprot:XP_002683299.1 predicted protein [Naegleria gruberi strain NEG-M]